jgi:hypothetical protein
MKLTTETISVLKNFSTINANLMVKSGSSLSTMSSQKNIVARADVVEKFPNDFAIYDLNDFLSQLSLFRKPDLEFNADNKPGFVIITEEGTSDSLQYWFSSPDVVTTPSKEISMPSTELTFTLSSETLARVIQAGAVVGAPDMALTGGKLTVTDKKNKTANVFETSLDVGNVAAEYKFWFKVENLKVIPGTYDVEVSSKKISHFTNTTLGVQYWIALEQESKYKG